MSVSISSHLRLRSRSLTKILLLSGIAYGVLPVIQAQAAGSSHTHKHSTSSRKVVKASPSTGAQVAAPSASVPVTSNNVPASVVRTDRAAVVSDMVAQNEETVRVTGSRLKQSRLTDTSSGQSVDAKQLAARGYTNIGLALLRENPAFSVPSNSQIGTQGSYGAGQTFASLFGLGPQRTLTLINGMRMVSGATLSNFGAGTGSQVDVGTIPTSLVKRVDQKSGGSGAAYGSDAVAGVVNYILDDHYEGVELNAQGSWTQQLKAPQEKIYFKAGRSFNEGKGHVVFDIEYRNAGGLTSGDYPDEVGANAEKYTQPILGDNTPYSYQFNRGTTSIQTSMAGIPLVRGSGFVSNFGKIGSGIPNSAGQALQFSPDGKSLIPITYDSLSSSRYSAFGGNGLNTGNYSQLFTPSSNLNLTTLGHYDVSDHLRLQWQGWYQRGEAESSIATGYPSASYYGAPLSMSSVRAGQPNGAFKFSTDNPYLTPEQRNVIRSALIANKQSPDSFYLNRLSQDLQSNMFRTDNQMFRFAGGADGDFSAFNRKFSWKIQAEYSKYLNDTWQPKISTQNMLNALDAVRLPDGSIGCRAGVMNSTAVTRSNVCAPLNLFGEGLSTPGAVDYITADTHVKNSNAQRDLQAELSSTLFRLPAGDIKWDIGYEHRREGYNFTPDAFTRGEPLADGTFGRYGASIPIPPASGAYHTHEAFGELDVPLVSPQMHVPGVYSLSAQANGRYIRNSATGSYWAYYFGGSWWPTQDVGFSGNYAQSNRNPSVSELYLPPVSIYQRGTDPCDVLNINSGVNPAMRAANCAAAGIPKGFDSRLTHQNQLGNRIGNPDLQNETSHSYTAAIHIMPRWISGLNIEGAFTDVKMSNVISTLGLTDFMQSCYDSNDYAHNEYCNRFHRDPETHYVDSFNASYFNLASLHMQVVQSSLDYILPLRRIGLPETSGMAEIKVNYVHYVKNNEEIGGTVYPSMGETGSPNDNFTINANYTRGPLFVQWQTLLYGKSKYDNLASEFQYPDNDRSAFAYFNSTIGYKFGKHFNASFMINNVTDARPAHIGTVSQTRYWDAIIGRSFMLDLGASF